jgi:hypothetical protein
MKRFVIILGIVFLLLGIVALIHPGFEYDKQTEVAKIGSLRATVEQQKTAQVPLGASIVMLVSGVVLIGLGLRAKQ